MKTPSVAANPGSSVLVVDDETALRFPISELLRDAGVIVVEAGNADEALAYLWADRTIGVVFSDVRMPGSMDGIGLAEVIETNFTDVRVILTSGNVPSQIDPFRQIIAKPYDLDEVLAQILDTLGLRTSFEHRPSAI
ncbi:response regulator [Asticcacaulis benevestitus]|uniref:Response regulatory domain-containing protein n=1 Tax=Asticcacaulis benevestitus DSM 16100 = ATCC BAA-896 TaxID=1121022 RepID=V4RNK2_9CAUL|nr:response regulator [Asticcacaulis benevestitus]ESQ92818.1 hypothetical protein ABENE_06870 [Asticcacaulis benevestitus DSM 16100 = ATCC BAA-896]